MKTYYDIYCKLIYDEVPEIKIAAMLMSENDMSSEEAIDSIMWTKGMYILCKLNIV